MTTHNFTTPDLTDSETSHPEPVMGASSLMSRRGFLTASTAVLAVAGLAATPSLAQAASGGVTDPATVQFMGGIGSDGVQQTVVSCGVAVASADVGKTIVFTLASDSAGRINKNGAAVYFTAPATGSWTKASIKSQSVSSRKLSVTVIATSAMVGATIGLWTDADVLAAGTSSAITGTYRVGSGTLYTSTKTLTRPAPKPRDRAYDLPANTTGKLVFAHYFTPYPESIDNQPPASDYYANGFLTPSGENGAHAYCGGLLRDRPLPHDPVSGDYVYVNSQDEVRQAISAGLDGFTIDVLSDTGAQWNGVLKMLDAAASVSSTFKVMAMPDMTSLDLSASALAKLMSTFAAKPAAFRLPDGRLAVAPFAAEAKDVSWWKSFLSTMASSYGITVALVPCFVGMPGDLSGWAAISYMLSDWGSRSPGNISADPANRAKAAGKPWMQAIAFQDVRPNQGVYDEALGLAALRTSWDVAFAVGAQWVQLTTWNDYSEGSSFAPSVHHRYNVLDVNAYYVGKFHAGSYPQVVGNALYVAHRTQLVNSKPSYPETQLMTARSNSSTPADIIDVSCFFTTAASVSVTTGGVTTTWQAPAGYSTHTVPLKTGTVSAKAVSNGVTVASLTSPWQVAASPYVQDLQYTVTGSLR